MKNDKVSREAAVAISRRRFVTGVTAGAAMLGIGSRGLLHAATSVPTAGSPTTLRGNRFDLDIGYRGVNFTGRSRVAMTVNGSVPGPVLRLREGERVTLSVRNQLAVDSSIHWHGIILPSGMDGVPGISFPGIAPGETFEYQYDVTQSGTYWYHSHSGFQEQTGVYGALVIDPVEPEPFSYDRDYVLLLSDWSDEDPEAIFARLKKLSHYYNWTQRTAGDTVHDLRTKGLSQTWKDRAMWHRMRMSDNDLSDVSGSTYTFLLNGRTPAEGWTGLFARGERVRLRIINAAAMTFFDLRIPGLDMTVVAADGQNIEPVTVEEIRLGVAETYDVIVSPSDDRAYTIFAQAIDRTGFARGTLTPDPALVPDVPAMDPAQTLRHMDMGMAHGAHADHAGMDHSQHGAAGGTIAPAGAGSLAPVVHAKSEFGPGVDMRAEAPQYRLDDPGPGLRDNGRRVLVYSDLRNLYPTPDPRDPGRELQLHLTGNMRRYMWSIDGVRFSDAEPLRLAYGERVRVTLVNDTMMNHPIHLHGMWSDLETGDGERIPRKHTVIVQPGAKLSYLVTADAKGSWAYHCHLLYHMMGMFRAVEVS